MLILFALPLAITAIIFESYPRFINRYCGVDIWTHLLYLQEYRRQKGIPKKIDKGFIVPGSYDYPPAFIFIMSKFPSKYVEKYEFLFSPFFDAIQLILIFILAYIFTQNILLAFATQFLYLLTPIIVLENSSATPRSLGYVLFTLVFISMFFFEANQQMYYVLFAMIAGAFIFLSHRFTTQSFLFFSLFFSIIHLNFWYMVVFIVSFLLAIIFSRGFYWTVLKGHLGNLRFWRKIIKYRFAHQIRGTSQQHKTNDFVFRLYNEFLRLPPFVLAITNPWTLPVLYLYLFLPSQNLMISRLEELVLFSYLLALATIWVPQIRFLGEGQRYLELSAFPAAFLSVLFLNSLQHTSSFSTALIICGLVCLCSLVTIVVIQQKAIIKDKLRTLTPGLLQMFAYLKSLKRKPRLLCIPHQITTNTIYHTDCPVFVNADYTNIEKISDVYPFMKKPVRQIMKTHKLDAILLNEEYAEVSELKLGKHKVVKRYDNYLLLKPL